MKVLQMIWSLAPENGGPTRSTIGLARALTRAGADVTLFSHVRREGLEDEPNLKFRFGSGYGFRQSLCDARAIIREFKPDVVHVQGIWNPSTHSDSLAAAEAGVPIVVSPRGMLAPWALRQKRLKKLVGMFLYQRGDLKRAAAFHVTSEDEASHVRLQHLKQPVFVIPNGVDDPPVLSRPCSCGPTSPESRTVLFLARLHPGKGLMLLAEAWGKLRPEGWRVMVVGANKCHQREDVEQRVKELGIADQWTFCGEADDARKWQFYAQADLFVLPTASENFGLSIAEALNSGTPVITTKGTPWQDIDGTCGWWIDRDVDSLVAALKDAMRRSPDELRSMGEIGHCLIAARYAWAPVAKQMKEVYEALVRR